MTIGVFFGGKSPEHDISIITAQLVMSGLRDLGYGVVPIYLTKKGEWLIDKQLGSIDFFKQAEPPFHTIKHFYLDLNAKKTNQLIFQSRNPFVKKIKIDLAFPAFHGQNGEDGTIQGLFEIMNVPYVGCGVAASAMAIDKVLTKLFYEKYNIPTVKFIYFFKKDWENNKAALLKEIDRKLKWPFFVKPARLGSSIGIAKVVNQEELIFAVEVALHYDEKILVEESVENVMDVTCAILGNDEPRASLLQESVFRGKFFSYEDKYLKGGGTQLGKAKKDIIIPARLDKKTTEQIRQTALQVFKLFGCTGTARIDFLYDKKNRKFFVNEINTLPGTLYHHLWKASGVGLNQLLLELIGLAQENYQRKKSLISVFESDVLKQTDWSGKLGGKI